MDVDFMRDANSLEQKNDLRGRREFPVQMQGSAGERERERKEGGESLRLGGRIGLQDRNHGRLELHVGDPDGADEPLRELLEGARLRGRDKNHSFEVKKKQPGGMVYWEIWNHLYEEGHVDHQRGDHAADEAEDAVRHRGRPDVNVDLQRLSTRPH